MLRVFIPSGNFHIDRQLPKHSEQRIGECEFVFNPEEKYDYFVTLDGLTEPIDCKVNKNHRLLFLGEPPYVKQYNKNFIKQYGHVFSCQNKKIEKGEALKSFPVLPWMIGMSFQENSHTTKNDIPYLSYDDFKLFKGDSERLNKCCLITSNKKFTKGHRDRVHFADYVLDNYSDIIDVYGNGYNPIPDKIEVLKKYKYAIVIENCKYPDYWTEKIGDCFLSGCYPIYHGCTNIEEYFPIGSYSKIDICRIEESVDSIKRIMEMNTFEKSLPALQQAKDLVLDEYNIFPRISKAIEEIEKKQNYADKGEESVILHPMRLSIVDKIKQKIAWKFNILI